jgi:hypothetical protein
MYRDFLHEAPPTDACAAFIKESRMKFVNARKLDRKSRVYAGANMGHPSRGRTSFLLPTPMNRTKVSTPKLISVRRTQVQFSWLTETVVSPAPANLDSSEVQMFLRD